MDSDIKKTPVAIVEGKTTPFGFNILLNQPIPRNAYLMTEFEDKTFVFAIQKLWNDQAGKHATITVIGAPPLTPFNLDIEIFLADFLHIEEALGLNLSSEKSMFLGEILHSDVKAKADIQNLGRVFITGKSGSGKSYTVGVIIEELIKKQIPTIIIDRHGEYSSLKILKKEYIPDDEKFFDKTDLTLKYAQKIIEFGDSEINNSVDLGIEYLLAADIEEIVLPGHCIILNLSGMDIPYQKEIINRFCYSLYKASTLHKIPPHYIFIDEAHLFAGKKSSPITDTLRLSAQEGRKFGHNLVVITQKPQLLDTTIRAQAGTWIIHKLTDVNDIKITVNSAEGLNSDADEEIQNLSPGEAIITGDLAPLSPLRVKVRKRYTVHGGSGFDPLKYITSGEKLPKSDLIQKLRNKFSANELQDSIKEIFDEKQLNSNELSYQIDSLKKENLELKQVIIDFEDQIENLQKENLPQNDISSQMDQMMEDIDKTQILDTNDQNEEDLPLSGDVNQVREMYENKLTDLMSERDDISIQLQETIDDKNNIEIELQTLQLEMSGTKVENEELKNKLTNETKRADEAVQLAERCVAAMKKKR